jgi:hypothetical protein
MDCKDYIVSQGGGYLPFPAAVEFKYECDWAISMWEALLAGHRPPAHRVADLLKRQEKLKPYLPAEIAKDYPDVPNPWGRGDITSDMGCNAGKFDLEMKIKP